jgi:hypothetical protein
MWPAKEGPSANDVPTVCMVLLAMDSAANLGCHCCEWKVVVLLAIDGDAASIG